MGSVAAADSARFTFIITLFLAKHGPFASISARTNLMTDLDYIPKRDRGTDDFSVRAFSPDKPGV